MCTLYTSKFCISSHNISCLIPMVSYGWKHFLLLSQITAINYWRWFLHFFVVAVFSFSELKAKDSGAFDTKPIDTMVSMLFYGGVDLCNLTLTNPDVRALFNRTYDLVIVDVFGTESLIGLGQIFDAPVIGFTAYSMARWSNLLPLSCNLNFPASLFHRLHNSISCMHESIVLAYLHHPLQVIL